MWWVETKTKQNNKKLRIAKTILYNKGTSEGITIPDFKLYYRATVMKTDQYWHKHRRTNELKSRPKYQPTYLRTPDFYKEARNIKWKKESILNEWSCHNWILICRRMPIGLFIDRHNIRVQMDQRLQHEINHTEPHRREIEKQP